VPNFRRFLPSQILRGRCPPNFVHGLTPPFSGTSRGKVSLGAKDFEAHTLHFKAIFDPFLKKIVGGTPSLVGYTQARLGHSVACVKISGRSAP